MSGWSSEVRFLDTKCHLQGEPPSARLAFQVPEASLITSSIAVPPASATPASLACLMFFIPCRTRQGHDTCLRHRLQWSFSTWPRGLLTASHFQIALSERSSNHSAYTSQLSCSVSCNLPYFSLNNLPPSVITSVYLASYQCVSISLSSLSTIMWAPWDQGLFKNCYFFTTQHNCLINIWWMN